MIYYLIKEGIELMKSIPPSFALLMDPVGQYIYIYIYISSLVFEKKLFIYTSGLIDMLKIYKHVSLFFLNLKVVNLPHPKFGFLNTSLARMKVFIL